MKRKIAWKNIIKSLVALICVGLFIWFVASFIDVNMCNDPYGKNYQDFTSWNLFVNFMN